MMLFQVGPGDDYVLTVEGFNASISTLGDSMIVNSNSGSLLLVQVYKPFSKSMLNRKMVFRVTKSQSMKDKLSFF